MQRIDILWRDIPSQVLIKRGRERGKYMLSARFQEAIDRAAMRADKGGSDAYLEEWRRVTNSIEAEGALEDIAQRLGKEVEAQVSDDQLALLVKQKGFGVHVMAYPLEDRIGEIVSRSNALNDREPWPLAV